MLWLVSPATRSLSNLLRKRRQFNESLSALPGRNFGTFAALILISSLVRGLRPVRAARLLTMKVPNPTSVTELPRFKLPRMPATIASRARPAAALEMSACLAMWSINSVLFTLCTPVI